MDLIFPSLAAVLSLTLIGAVFGLILSISKIKLKVDKDPRIEKLVDILPGANCGACGLPGCSAYATKIVEEKISINLCPVGGDDVAKNVAEVMGMEAEEAGIPLIARVHCHGGLKNTTLKFIYNGPKECSAADDLMSGFRVCEYGCLGLGDCERSCLFDAIYIGDNDLPIVDLENCVGCGKCVEACPRGIISLVPENFNVYVMCRNMEKAPVMKKGCSVGCIGCKRCEKACKEVFADNSEIETAIVVDNFLAVIDFDKCTNCLVCAEECPVPVIYPLEMSKKQKEREAKIKAEANA